MSIKQDEVKTKGMKENVEVEMKLVINLRKVIKGATKEIDHLRKLR